MVATNTRFHIEPLREVLLTLDLPQHYMYSLVETIIEGMNKQS